MSTNNKFKIIEEIINNLKNASHHSFPKHVVKKIKDPNYNRKLSGTIVERVNTYQMPHMMRSNRNYGEYCTDFIEQNALELYLLGKLDDDMGTGVARLKQRIEDRNPHTKIFQQGIVKLASKKKSFIDGEENVNATLRSKVTLLRDRRDYGIPPKKKRKRKNK